MRQVEGEEESQVAVAVADQQVGGLLNKGCVLCHRNAAVEVICETRWA